MGQEMLFPPSRQNYPGMLFPNSRACYNPGILFPHMHGRTSTTIQYQKKILHGPTVQECYSHLPGNTIQECYSQIAEPAIVQESYSHTCMGLLLLLSSTRKIRRKKNPFQWVEFEYGKSFSSMARFLMSIYLTKSQD